MNIFKDLGEIREVSLARYREVHAAVVLDGWGWVWWPSLDDGRPDWVVLLRRAS